MTYREKNREIVTKEIREAILFLWRMQSHQVFTIIQDPRIVPSKGRVAISATTDIVKNVSEGLESAR